MPEPRRKPVGGILEIGMTPAVNIAAVACDPSTGRCTGVTLHDPARWRQLRIAEERSSCDETFDIGKGVPAVEHRLTVVTGADDGHEAFDAPFIAAAAQGMVAVATFISGRRLLLGWSPRFGTEQPLRLRQLRFTSGTARAEAPAAKALFTATDTDAATELTPEARIG